MTGRGSDAPRCARCGGILTWVSDARRGQHWRCTPRQPRVEDPTRTVGLSLRQAHVDKLDELAKRDAVSRSGAAQRLIEEA